MKLYLDKQIFIKSVVLGGLGTLIIGVLLGYLLDKIDLEPMLKILIIVFTASIAIPIMLIVIALTLARVSRNVYR